jgi:hypothetical protein
LTSSTETDLAGRWAAWAKPTFDTHVRLVTGEVALSFAAAEGIHLEDLACRPLVLDQSGVYRWPLGPDRHFPPPLAAGEIGSPIFTASQFRRFYDANRDGLIKRDFHHPDGRFGIGTHRSALRIEVGLGRGAAVFRAVGRHYTIHIPQMLPASLRLALKGRNLNEVVAHELFALHQLKIASVVQTPRGATRITVYDAPVHIEVLARVRWIEAPVINDLQDDVPF